MTDNMKLYKYFPTKKLKIVPPAHVEYIKGIEATSCLKEWSEV